MSEPALCQCVRCHKYLACNRNSMETSFDYNACTECHGQLPLAKLRVALQDPLSVEILGLMTEECGEVSQRIGKIMRWGWEADFEGTTQQHKLEIELGDIVAAVALAVHNGLITRRGVLLAAVEKLRKFHDDAKGPRQRLQVAQVPDRGMVYFAIPQPGEVMSKEAFEAATETVLALLDNK